MKIKLHQMPGVEVKPKAHAMLSLSLSLWSLSKLENCLCTSTEIFCTPLHKLSHRERFRHLVRQDFIFLKQNKSELVRFTSE